MEVIFVNCNCSTKMLSTIMLKQNMKNIMLEIIASTQNIVYSTQSVSLAQSLGYYPISHQICPMPCREVCLSLEVLILSQPIPITHQSRNRGMATSPRITISSISRHSIFFGKLRGSPPSIHTLSCILSNPII